ncbi:rab proteins geranylgeranyltransferase component A 1 [Hylaeus anthracinus]|uniref:rab proteins geranylgeranyltransferase component A 1 n=1 Tax=Hylaeus volcanicus TaxID=313075 RepID=UPI0023B87E97|nr:rab proteins geranylgeranyltransferase component A 1 [Hylaeus volcanicus]XP_054002164.1 rab proteins geranylgeranyltransferase component A 1 [Hylaeus anthracinus]
MEDDLPTKYDVIVVGTGMTESIVAAAASRIGKKVLHLDSNEYYGGLWATFNFDGLQKWIEDLKVPKNNTIDVSGLDLEDGEKFLKASDQYSTVKNIEETWYISNEADLPVVSSKDTQTDSTGDGTGSSDEKADGDKVEKKENVKQWSIDRIRMEYRKFNIDLAPKLLFARGELVELLISSNISRYTEFRSVSRVATFMDGKLTQVPCSRADVFANKTVSLVEKRMLMKLLTSCMVQGADSPEFDGFQDKTFLEYLNTKNLTPIVQHYIVQAIAMATEKTSCRDGVNRTKHFLNSLGRYGNTPFLWPMYSSGELPQCFCRLCAVFGGVYCLKRQLDGVVIDNDKCKAIISGKQRLTLEHLVVGQGHLPPEIVAFEGEQRISRGVFITDRSIMQGEKENLTLLYYPPEEPGQEPITLIELGPSTNACPQGLFMVHMTCKRTTNAKEDLAYVVNKFLKAEPFDPSAIRSSIHSHTQTVSPDKRHLQEGSETDKEEASENPKPQVLWSLYLNLPASDIKLNDSAPSNLHLCSGPDLELDFDFAVHQAKSIFKAMYPEEDFLPRAPDPEEIVLEEAPGPKFEGDIEVEEKQDVEKAEKEE